MRGILILLLLVIVGYFAYTNWGRLPGQSGASNTAGTSGAFNTEKARETGAQLGEKAAAAGARVQEGVSEAAITTKIKAKMALDDSVKSRTIDVSTTRTTVTLGGSVRSAAEHERAVALARETVGVTKVVDHLNVER
jgi:osmotically-inducible protein OsmY